MNRNPHRSRGLKGVKIAPIAATASCVIVCASTLALPAALAESDTTLKAPSTSTQGADKPSKLRYLNPVSWFKKNPSKESESKSPSEAEIETKDIESPVVIDAKGGADGEAKVEVESGDFKAEVKTNSTTPDKEIEGSTKAQLSPKTKVEIKKDPMAVEDSTAQKQLDQQMIEDSNKIPGVEIKADEFHEDDKFTIGDLNPFKWIFKPVTDMQKRVIHLEKQMMRLEGPIANLQKPMIGLRKDMVGVQKDLGDVRGDMNSVRGKMDSLEGNLGDIGGQMHSVNQGIGGVRSQIKQMEGPLVALKDPVIGLQKPVSGVDMKLERLETDLDELKEVVTLTSTLILIAIVGVGLAICVGTPVAALFAFRHRKAILRKFGGADSNEVDPLNGPEEETVKEERMTVGSGKR